MIESKNNVSTSETTELSVRFKRTATLEMSGLCWALVRWQGDGPHCQSERQSPGQMVAGFEV